MGFLEGIGAWLLKILLDWLLGKATKKTIEIKNQLELERKRNEINLENVKKYEEASSRADRIKAAVALLNGERTP